MNLEHQAAYESTGYYAAWLQIWLLETRALAQNATYFMQVIVGQTLRRIAVGKWIAVPSGDVWRLWDCCADLGVVGNTQRQGPMDAGGGKCQ